MAHSPQFWLLKTEPESFSIHDLATAPNRATCWDGVRNYQARNYMRDEMQLDDRIFLYHSNANPPAIVGTAVVIREAYPDHTAWEPGNHHFDAKASPENPIWVMVDIQLEQVFPEPLGLDLLREVPALADMVLLRKGSRLSVQPVTKQEFDAVMRMAHTRGSRAERAAAAARAKKKAAKAKPRKKAKTSKTKASSTRTASASSSTTKPGTLKSAKTASKRKRSKPATATGKASVKKRSTAKKKSSS